MDQLAVEIGPDLTTAIHPAFAEGVILTQIHTRFRIDDAIEKGVADRAPGREILDRVKIAIANLRVSLGKGCEYLPPDHQETVAKISNADEAVAQRNLSRIEEIDAALAKGEADLADPALYTRDPERFARITAALDKLRAEKEAAELRWLELAELVEG